MQRSSLLFGGQNLLISCCACNFAPWRYEFWPFLHIILVQFILFFMMQNSGKELNKFCPPKKQRRILAITVSRNIHNKNSKFRNIYVVPKSLRSHFLFVYSCETNSNFNRISQDTPSRGSCTVPKIIWISAKKLSLSPWEADATVCVAL